MSTLKSHFNNLPISRKILAITIISSFSTLFLLCTLSFIRERDSYFKRQISNLDTLARILGSNTVAALRFNDRHIAKQYVDSFRHESDIESVAIYTLEDEVFAFYSQTPESSAFPAPKFLGEQWDNGRLFFSSEVRSDGGTWGKILIEMNTRSLDSSIWNLLWTNLVFLVGGLGVTIILVSRLQKVITKPINDLVGVTRHFASQNDIEVKAHKRYNDEIGSLADSVNEMLETIRLRDESLRKANSNLEQTVEKRTRDLNERNQSLKKAIEAASAAAKAKSDFLATTSHELRTPLNPIIGYVDRLLGKTHDLESLRELEIIKQSAELLLRLIDDILDFSRVERGDIRLQKDDINLQKCCSDVIYLMRSEANNKELDLEFKFVFPEDYAKDKAVIFETDGGRLKQVVLNLIGNAIKFTDKGKITITTRIEKSDSDLGKLHLSVEDTGIGINPKDLDKLFKPFSQVDGSLSREYKGMGLGLAISRAFIHAMGGVINCSSVEGKGSTFWFEIPIVLKGQIEQTEPIISTFEHAAFSHDNQSILIVDDERVNRELGASMIRSLGYNVVCAKDGLEALDLSGEHEFSLILMDIRMPRMDGFSTAKAIRERLQKNSTTPIIAVSAHITPEDEERCLEVGINDYLQKPLKMEILNEYLRKWFLTQNR